MASKHTFSSFYMIFFNLQVGAKENELESVARTQKLAIVWWLRKICNLYGREGVETRQ